MTRVVTAIVGMAAVLALAAAPAASGTGEEQAGNAGNGQKVYAAQKCSTCHRIGTTGGKLGPDLSNVGSTRDTAWLEKYLANPKSVNPKNVMPAVKVKGQELQDLIAYMLSLKKK